jgi:hypothetical protein
VDEAAKNIRESALNTLTFLASPDAQREFATKVHYANYRNEFACWWFDTFIPGAYDCFSASELPILREFSATFDASLQSLSDAPTTIEQLLADETWRNVVAAARHACASLRVQA